MITQIYPIAAFHWLKLYHPRFEKAHLTLE